LGARLSSTDVAVIQLEGLTKRFGSTDALQALTLDVEEGEVLGFLGPNGAGKTTTIRLLLGLIRPTAGSASVFGLDAQADAIAIHKRLAYVPGDTALWPSLTGEETLHFFAELHGSVDTAYRDELIELFDFDPKKKTRAYSKGNRQKVVLIAALASRAELLVLDEPTSGLDPLIEQKFRGCLGEARQRGQTVFLSSHILSEVEATADRVAILRSGRLVEFGTMDELRIASAVSVELKFAAAPPALTGVAGLKDVEVDGNRVRCHVTGPIQPLLDAVAGHPVVEMLSREPSLEELFLAHYGA
jgi:ABC-2 type transport system ATP-binding protein